MAEKNKTCERSESVQDVWVAKKCEEERLSCPAAINVGFGGEKIGGFDGRCVNVAFVVVVGSVTNVVCDAVVVAVIVSLVVAFDVDGCARRCCCRFCS